MELEHKRETHACNGQSWISEAKSLSDEVLIGRLKQCVAQDRRLTARLLEHFAEVERRGLYRDQGYASMFVYAVHALHMSEPEAGLRIGVARVCSKFPRALELLASGELHMSALKVLAPVLTSENQGLLERARFKSKQEVLELRAKHFPRADEPTSIRRVPSRTTVEPAAQRRVESAPSESAVPPSSFTSPSSALHRPARHGVTVDSSTAEPSSPAAASSAPTSSPSSAGIATEAQNVCPSAAPSSVSSLVPPSRSDALSDCAAAIHGVGSLAAATMSTESAPMTGPSRPSSAGAPESSGPEFRLKPTPAVSIAALSEGRHALRFTIDQRMLDKIRQAQDLLRHQLPTGDIVVLFERALDLLIAERMNKLWGHPAKPRPGGEGEQRRRRADTGRSAGATPGASIAPRSEPFAEGASNQLSDPIAVTEPSVATDAAQLVRCEPQTVEASIPDAAGRSATSSSPPRTLSNQTDRSVLQASRTMRPSFDRRGATRPKKVAPTTGRTPRANSRYVRRAVRRALLERDGAQCTFVGPDGHRCTERGWLQRDHKTPFGRGGPSTLENMRLYCRLCRTRHK
jgi:hypothetical protein